MSEPCSQQALINKINHSQGVIEGSVKMVVDQGKVNQGMYRDLMIKFDRFIEKIDQKHQDQENKIDDVKNEHSKIKGWITGAGTVFGIVYAGIGLFLNWFKFHR